MKENCEKYQNHDIKVHHINFVIIEKSFGTNSPYYSGKDNTILRSSAHKSDGAVSR